MGLGLLCLSGICYFVRPYEWYVGLCIPGTGTGPGQHKKGKGAWLENFYAILGRRSSGVHHDTSPAHGVSVSVIDVTAFWYFDPIRVALCQLDSVINPEEGQNCHGFGTAQGGRRPALPVFFDDIHFLCRR